MLNSATDAIEGPAFVVRLDGPAIIEANAKALAIWGIAAPGDLPVAIDAAMPAVRHLAASPSPGPDDTDPAGAPVQLVFWTKRGAQRLQCRWRFAADGGDVLVVIDETGPGTTAATPHATAQPPPLASPSATPALAPPAQPIDLRTMAHELRTPIGAVIALADMIDQQHFGPLGDPRYREYARDIRDSAHLALNIVAAALEHDPVAETILPGGITEIDPERLLRKARRALRPNAQAAGLALEVEAAPGLPVVLANLPGLTQILLNLTANAIKFTPPGGHITLAARTTAGGGLEISVRDTGIGMTELETSVLVSAALRSTSADGDGEAAAAGDTAEASDEPARPRRGIGFTLVRRLADAMHAALDVTSERGVGTRVGLTFPASLVIPREHQAGERPASRNGE